MGIRVLIMHQASVRRQPRRKRRLQLADDARHAAADLREQSRRACAARRIQNHGQGLPAGDKQKRNRRRRFCSSAEPIHRTWSARSSPSCRTWQTWPPSLSSSDRRTSTTPSSLHGQECPSSASSLPSRSRARWCRAGTGRRLRTSRLRRQETITQLPAPVS
jgi:hypothetical protein